MRKFLSFFLMIQLLISCGNARKATYFQNVRDAEVYTNLVVPEHVIVENDILDVNIKSINEEASEMFNAPRPDAQSTTSTGNILEPTGYKVTREGTIDILLLGDVEVVGLTTSQVQQKIKNLLIENQYLLDPVVNVRIMNFKVTVLGEVTRPTVITVSEEKITLLDALGLAGDITLFGKRNNILLIRKEDGVTVTHRIDLNSNEIFTSPFYYLRSNDVLYVEPTNTRIASSSLWYQLLPTIIGGLSIAIFVLDRLR